MKQRCRDRHSVRRSRADVCLQTRRYGGRAAAFGLGMRQRAGRQKKESAAFRKKRQPSVCCSYGRPFARAVCKSAGRSAARHIQGYRQRHDSFRVPRIGKPRRYGFFGGTQVRRYHAICPVCFGSVTASRKYADSGNKAARFRRASRISAVRPPRDFLPAGVPQGQ